MQEFKAMIVRKEGQVGYITLNRPKALNAMNEELLLEIPIALKSLENETRQFDAPC